MQLNCRFRNSGFSLLELVITIGILSIGVTLILEGFSFSARSAGLVYDMSKAISLAEDKAQELEYKEQHFNLTVQSIEDKKEMLSWKYDTSLIPDAKLYKLNLKVFWQRNNSPEEISLNSYLFPFKE